MKAKNYKDAPHRLTDMQPFEKMEGKE